MNIVKEKAKSFQVLYKKADKNIVVVDLGRIEGIMLAKEQVPTENIE